MNNDLISRSALIAHIGDLGSDSEDDTTFLTMGQACAIAHKRIVDMVKAAPAVDAVEVVRCKDCKHFYDTHINPAHSCKRGGTQVWDVSFTPDDFCSYGERRADDA